MNETGLLDFKSDIIQNIIVSRGWHPLDEKSKILNAYNFVRDEIKFGYNIADNIPSSKVLQDGYGQCNTKGILFMSLLRALRIPCRFHGFTIDKNLQKGAITGIWYFLAPKEIVHSWIEIYYRGNMVLPLTILNHRKLIGMRMIQTLCPPSDE